MGETKQTVRVDTRRDVMRWDLAIDDALYDIVELEGTMTLRETVDHPHFDGMTTEEIVEALTTPGDRIRGMLGLDGLTVVRVDVTRPNPAYSGPDALFPDMTPPETITETVTL
jgi:hypothetical protein